MGMFLEPGGAFKACNWPVPWLAISLSLLLMLSIKLKYINLVDLWPQQVVTAKVTDFHYIRTDRNGDHYSLAYEYDWDKKHHLEPSSDYMVAQGNQHPELGVYPTLLINVMKDCSGNYISNPRFRTASAWCWTLVFLGGSLSFWLIFFIQLRMHFSKKNKK